LFYFEQNIAGITISAQKSEYFDPFRIENHFANVWPDFSSLHAFSHSLARPWAISFFGKLVFKKVADQHFRHQKQGMPSHFHTGRRKGGGEGEE